jgi:hypothetical protein
MYTTTDENGILNNFACEPKMYLAESPSKQQKWGYIFKGVIATFIIAASIVTAVVVS